jgi:hypothetical protein
MKVKPMGMRLVMPAGWVNRHQQDVIECLKEENKILHERQRPRANSIDHGRSSNPARNGENDRILRHVPSVRPQEPRARDRLPGLPKGLPSS